jgi:hypothetical protein
MPADWQMPKKAPHVHSLCGIMIGRDMGRWTQFSLCNRIVTDPAQPWCNTHNGIRKRQLAKEQIEIERRAKVLDDEERRQAIVAEVRELWDTACDQRDIEQSRRGRIAGHSMGISVDHELLRTFLRELVEAKS